MIGLESQCTSGQQCATTLRCTVRGSLFVFTRLGACTARTPTRVVAVLFPNVFAAADKIKFFALLCSVVCLFQYLSTCPLKLNGCAAKHAESRLLCIHKHCCCYATGIMVCSHPRLKESARDQCLPTIGHFLFKSLVQTDCLGHSERYET